MEANNALTLGNLPTRNTCIKLAKISFASPSKNFAVYKFCNKVIEMLDYIEFERTKLVKKYGDPTEEDGEFIIPKNMVELFQEEFSKMLLLSIDSDFPKLGLTEEDFADDQCAYPDDKTYWLNAGEISTLLRF